MNFKKRSKNIHRGKNKVGKAPIKFTKITVEMLKEKEWQNGINNVNLTHIHTKEKVNCTRAKRKKRPRFEINGLCIKKLGKVLFILKWSSVCGKSNWWIRVKIFHQPKLSYRKTTAKVCVKDDERWAWMKWWRKCRKFIYQNYFGKSKKDDQDRIAYMGKEKKPHA